MAGGPGYTSKPRPAVIIQEDGFAETLSIAVCSLTSESIDAPILRILVEPTPANRSPQHQPPDGGQGDDRAQEPAW
jgi:mRNA interferase MazF